MAELEEEGWKFSSLTEIADLLLELVKSWKLAKSRGHIYRKDESFNNIYHEIIKKGLAHHQIEKVLSFLDDEDPYQDAQITLKKMLSQMFPNLLAELDARTEHERLQKEEAAKLLKIEGNELEINANIAQLNTYMGQKKKLISKIDGDIHPTILDATTLLNKRNLIATSSMILMIALIADGNLNDFQVFGIKAGQMNPAGMWLALLAGLLYLGSYYYGRIRHYSSVISNNQSNIQAIDKANENIVATKSKVASLNKETESLKFSLKITEKNEHGPFAEEDLSDVANPFKLNSSRRRLFKFYDIVFPFGLALVALVTAVYQIWVYEPTSSESTAQTNQTISHPIPNTDEGKEN